MTAKTFEEWCESPEGSEAAIRQARAIHSGPHAYGEAAWTASRAALLADRPDVARVLSRLRDVDAPICDSGADAIESLAAQLAERDAEIAELHASQADRAIALANAEAELAKLKTHANDLALEMELLLDFVRGYQGCKFIAANAALTAYRRDYPVTP